MEESMKRKAKVKRAKKADGKLTVIPQQIPVAIPQNVEINPMMLIQQGVAQGIDLDKLQKLMELQERFEKNEAQKAFTIALNAFKANPPEVFKSKNVNFDTSHGRTDYDYAPLDVVADVIGQSLSKHGLSFRWDINNKTADVLEVSCVLTHEKGHSERVSIIGKPDVSGSKNGIQSIGSTITYLERYSLFAVTGIAAKNQDDDGHGASARPNVQYKDKPKPAPTATVAVNQTEPIKDNFPKPHNPATPQQEKGKMSIEIGENLLIPSGKFKGTKFIDAPSWWLEWLFLQCTTPDKVQEILDKKVNTVVAELQQKLPLSDQQLSALIEKKFGFKTWKEMTYPEKKEIYQILNDDYKSRGKT
jgi:hypothetical protein